MRLFRVYVDGALFYHPHMSKLAVTEAKIQEDAENIDSLTLSAPFSHPYLSSIKPMASTIVCVKGDAVVFEGRALDDGSGFYNTHTWTCESCLAYLKDTVQPPFSYQGTLRGLLELFVMNHNAAVEEKKRFTMGNVTVTDDNDYINRSSTEYAATLDAIREKLLDTHGGYLTVRYENNVKYLDWLADFDTASVQTVEFGKNLLDVKISRDHTERATALIPLGARITDESETETDERVTIETVNDGVNYIYDETAVAEIGWIWKTEVWEDVTLPANLLRKARARLAELVSGVTSMELTIVDESDTGADIGDIHARQYVDCSSPPHGISGRFLCVSRTRDYLHPAGNTVTIGAGGVTLTSLSARQGANLSGLESDVLGQTSRVDAIAEKVQDVDALKVNVQECYSEITKTSEQITSAVRETYATKSDLETYQRDFQASITETATEIRMDFSTTTSSIMNQVSANQTLLEEYIRFKGALIELGKVGNSFTAELSNEELAFKEDGQTIAYISNQSLVITNAEIRNRLSLGTEERGWFDFLPRANGNLSVVWRDPTS